MFAVVRTRLVPVLAAVLSLLGSATAAEAGWVTLRNDSREILVVQETVTTSGSTKRYRPVRLRPGESVREFQPTGATVKLEIFDGKTSSRLLCTKTRTTQEKDQTFSITID